MTSFTKLELAALRSIFSETPALAVELERQPSAAEVTHRENSGNGFFTTISVSSETPSLAAPSVLGNETQARVSGLEIGLGFILFMEDGRLALLEGYNYGWENTNSLDLNNMSFDIFRVPSTSRNSSHPLPDSRRETES